ncbi:hypothetical protein TNCV_1146651 [Trichonephila clavipes]|nr:hypothetical protein TNCV_1146651 [Trichonephila clavipes]
MAWPPPLAYALVISIETELGFIAEDHTPPVVTLQLTEVVKCPVDTVYDVGSVVDILMVVSSLYLHREIVTEWFPLIPLDVRKVLNFPRTNSSDVVGEDVGAHMIARSSHVFGFLGHPDPPQR